MGTDGFVFDERSKQCLYIDRVYNLHQADLCGAPLSELERRWAEKVWDKLRGRETRATSQELARYARMATTIHRGPEGEECRALWSEAVERFATERPEGRFFVRTDEDDGDRYSHDVIRAGGYEELPDPDIGYKPTIANRYGEEGPPLEVPEGGQLVAINFSSETVDQLRRALDSGYALAKPGEVLRVQSLERTMRCSMRRIRRSQRVIKAQRRWKRARQRLKIMARRGAREAVLQASQAQERRLWKRLEREKGRFWGLRIGRHSLKRLQPQEGPQEPQGAPIGLLEGPVAADGGQAPHGATEGP